MISYVARSKETLMPTRNVVLTDHHEEIIDRLVKSGRYQNASEVLRDGLRLVEQRDALEAAKLVALQDAARIGFREIDEGRFHDIAADDLEEFIGGLGRQAGDRVSRARK
jgi:antitoxin ParD1/3/4